jgi:hypothetical protein
MSKLDKAVDSAIAYLVGGPGVVGANYHAKASSFVKSETRVSGQEAERAVTLAAQRLGLYPANDFVLPYAIPLKHAFAIGDHVYGGRIVYDEYVAMNGTVVGLDHFRTKDGPMCLVEIRDSDGHKNSISDSSIYRVDWKEGWKNEPATPEQLRRLQRIKDEHDTDNALFVHSSLTKGEASVLIDTWPHPDSVGACHYCGADAFTFDFFDEPVCGQCGG